MMALLLLRSKLKGFYERYYHIVRGVGKAFVAFVIFFLTTANMNYSSVLSHYPLLIVGAVICAVTPDLITLLGIAGVMLLELYQISPVLAVFIFLLLVIYYLLFGRLTEKQGIVLVAIPVLSVLHLGYLVPIVAGLFFSPVMIPAFVLGTLLHFVYLGVQQYALATSRVTEEVSPMASLQYLSEYLKDNSFMVITLVAFLVTFVCVYMIRRAKIQYASQIAILVGAILLLSIMLLGNIGLELEVNLWEMIISILICVVLAYIIQFFYMSLDYQGTRKLQFEDDEYFYYVTAVPKFKVAVEDKTVTRIVTEDEDENIDLKTELEKALEEDENEMI